MHYDYWQLKDFRKIHCMEFWDMACTYNTFHKRITNWRDINRAIYTPLRPMKTSKISYYWELKEKSNLKEVVLTDYPPYYEEVKNPPYYEEQPKTLRQKIVSAFKTFFS